MNQRKILSDSLFKYKFLPVWAGRKAERLCFSIYVNWFEPDAFYLKESVLFFILKM